MFGLFGGKKKKEFMSDNSKAYFHIYCAKNITIDNLNFSELEHIKGDDLEDVIKVSPTTHTVTANYNLPANSLFNKRIKAKDISINCPAIEAAMTPAITTITIPPISPDNLILIYIPLLFFSI